MRWGGRRQLGDEGTSKNSDGEGEEAVGMQAASALDSNYRHIGEKVRAPPSLESG